MRALSFPKPSNTVYPGLRFADLANMRRQTEFNRKAFTGWTRQQPFNVENESLLVGILQQLSINPEWDLEYVVGYARFRSYSLCTLFKITSIHQVGAATTNEFYRNNTREHWCYIENTKKYIPGEISLKALNPVVPLCSTVTQHGYSHPLTRSKRVSSTTDDMAVMGIDIVELAVGWWLYQRLNRSRDTGPGAYIAQYPFVKAQLTHNQLTVINVLYEAFVHNLPLQSLITADTVIFTTSSEQKYYMKYLEFLIGYFSNHRLESFEHFLKTIESIYAVPYFNYISSDRNGLFAQAMWIWEPAILKLYSIYLTACNKTNRKASDINTIVERTHRERTQEYRRIPEVYFKQWFIDIADEAYMLNKANLNI